MRLIYPEWQCCSHPSVHAGARWLAAALPDDGDSIHIAAPEQETLVKTQQVYALPSIVERFRQAMRQLTARRPDRLQMIGGTCGAEVAPVAWLNQRYAGELAVIWFDAHADLNTPQSSPSGEFHGMVLRTLTGEGPRELVEGIARPLVPGQIFLAGVRELDQPERAFIERRNIALSPEIDASSAGRLCAAIRAAGYRRIYLHIDVDVLNPDSFSGALMPTPGGPTPAALSAALRRLSETFEVVGSSIVEYCGRTEQSRDQLIALLRDGGLLPTPGAAA
ncbi:arginase family protein [Affinibrenneria salicis]|uniref:Arginase family protein n=1 Tax=Affinibrenneria salicis TaxID=2590031 RepID=A0A5J5FTU0_9GAMM|nr:arginase family protein [Affinibrenneria salicis]KAA8996921.1 arginase family protein [Affinibrenneria salicis]